MASARKAKPPAGLSKLLREAARDRTPAEDAELESWLAQPPASMPARDRALFHRTFGRPPDKTLTARELAQLKAWWNEPTSPYVLRRVAGYLLTAWGDPAMFPDTWTADGKTSPAPTMPKPAPREYRKRGERYTDDRIFRAVASAHADGVKALGKIAEPGKPAKGYELWREVQPDADELPSAKIIRYGFVPPPGRKGRPGWRLRKGENTWAAVVRLARKSGHDLP